MIQAIQAICDHLSKMRSQHKMVFKQYAKDGGLTIHNSSQANLINFFF